MYGHQGSNPPHLIISNKLRQEIIKGVPSPMHHTREGLRRSTDKLSTKEIAVQEQHRANRVTTALSRHA